MLPRYMFCCSQHSLDELLILLRSTECQYVRCIKPNKLAAAAVFDIEYVDKQLKACGVMETVKIRSQAHAVRAVSLPESYFQSSLVQTQESNISASSPKSRSSENYPMQLAIFMG